MQFVAVSSASLSTLPLRRDVQDVMSLWLVVIVQSVVLLIIIAHENVSDVMPPLFMMVRSVQHNMNLI